MDYYTMDLAFHEKLFDFNTRQFVIYYNYYGI